ncbi:flagellar biosynthesis protein FlhB [Virgibacillus soli]|uniref:Flagellar biosynthetic protein FlhB n=2 Tax=Lederbergia galactosidilytica TaxID=217031 RepID=A0A177ZX91_9BACI|nr:flagellar biosynthesis protein FlhB [Virgibacillus soli]MBP1913641.1 flagellar biosynthetic protein FlhB [Lederbergia galactosidilytica]OAK72545.1 flagellar biosynthesis protein FlhB [Lederbergia galactosidilytica]
MQLKLDLQFFAGEKTEKATPKKRLDTRKKGQAAKSQDVNTAIGLLAVFMFLQFYSTNMGEIALKTFRHSFNEFMLMDLTEENIQPIILTVLKEVALLLGPVFLIALVAGVASNLLQVGFMFSTESIQPKLEKLDPIKGFKRIFSIRAIVELLKSVLKICFVGGVTFFVLYLHIEDVLQLSQQSVGAALKIVGKLTIQMGIAASLSLLALSMLDWLYQKYDFEKNIRMSKQDIKDEFKNSEGDPLIKSKIKQKQREMAMSRMMQEVPKADVIITNPTHYAIALKYDEKEADAPVVLAKGVDFLAQKIKLIAKENNIVMVENRPLARSLYDQLDIGDKIPDEFFKAVAEVLAYVYRIQNKI